MYEMKVHTLFIPSMMTTAISFEVGMKITPDDTYHLDMADYVYNFYAANQLEYDGKGSFVLDRDSGTVKQQSSQSSIHSLIKWQIDALNWLSGLLVPKDCVITSTSPDQYGRRQWISCDFTACDGDLVFIKNCDNGKEPGPSIQLPTLPPSPQDITLPPVLKTITLPPNIVQYTLPPQLSTITIPPIPPFFGKGGGLSSAATMKTNALNINILGSSLDIDHAALLVDNNVNTLSSANYEYTDTVNSQCIAFGTKIIRPTYLLNNASANCNKYSVMKTCPLNMNCTLAGVKVATRMTTPLAPTKAPTIHPSASPTTTTQPTKIVAPSVPTFVPSHRPTRTPTIRPTARPNTPRPTPPNAVPTTPEPTFAPTVAITTMDGSMTLGNVDLSSMSNDEKSVMATGLTNAIANVTHLSTDNIRNVTMVNENTRRGLRITQTELVRTEALKLVISYKIIANTADLFNALLAGTGETPGDGGGDSFMSSLATIVASKLMNNNGTSFVAALKSGILLASEDAGLNMTSLLQNMQNIEMLAVEVVDTTPTLSPTMSPSASPRASTSSTAFDDRTKLIIAVAVGGGGGIICLLVALWWCFGRSRKEPVSAADNGGNDVETPSAPALPVAAEVISVAEPMYIGSDDHEPVVIEIATVSEQQEVQKGESIQPASEAEPHSERVTQVETRDIGIQPNESEIEVEVKSTPVTTQSMTDDKVNHQAETEIASSASTSTSSNKQVVIVKESTEPVVISL
jgi:hypothetical protein